MCLTASRVQPVEDGFLRREAALKLQHFSVEGGVENAENASFSTAGSMRQPEPTQSRPVNPLESSIPYGSSKGSRAES
jgi:hypothetical protein